MIPKNILKLFLLSFLFMISAISISCQKQITFYDGDIIFHTSLSSQSRAIQLATDSPYSHVGIITFQNNKPFVLEAVQPVKLTPLNSWIKRGEHSEYVVKRLIKQELLTDAAIEKMQAKAREYLGKNYDSYFEWSDERIYCSELIWKLYKHGLNVELGSLRTLKDFSLENPIVKQKLRERYGDNIPLLEPVIAPSDIFESELLETVK